LQRQNGQIAVYSTAGAALVDGQPSTIGFDPTHEVTPYATQGGGQLSGLTINDQPVRTDSQRGALRGGALGAQFAIRDELGVEAQTEIDALARDLIERFQDPAVDPSLAPGDAGLFTDEGLALDPVNEVGLAQRLAVNAAVDPDQGGAVWRLRDGINAVAEGPVGEASLLNALSGALTAARPPASGSFAGQAQSASGLISSAISAVGVSRNASEQQLSFTSARLAELTKQQLADGVDTDNELQNLLQMQQTYAANARMIDVLDDLMQLITRI
jgi:flagellar hook-associated protein 1 FlgK